MLFALTAGCSDPEPGDNDDNGENPLYNYPDNGSGSHYHGVDFDAAFAAFSPDTVMIEIGNITVTWAELYVFLYHSIISLVDMYGTLPDWSEPLFGDLSAAEVILDITLEDISMFKTYEYGASITGTELSDDTVLLLDENFTSIIEANGGAEEFARLLWENNGFYSLDLYKNMIEMNYLINAIIDNLYGENGELISDDALAGYVINEGYMMAKHILRLKTTEEDDTPLDESNEILRLLNEYDGDDFEGFFDELMHEHNEDLGGMMSYPDGYLFLFQDMVAPFSAACLALDPGQFSDVVETEYGYHIILRLPIDYDTIPIADANRGYYRTFRQRVADEEFNAVVQTWLEDIDIVYTDAFNSLDISKIFVWCDH